MKKTIFQISTLLVFLFMLTACPYKSEVPIDEASIKVDKKLIGKWIDASTAADDNPKFYDIQKLDKVKYTIIENRFSTTDKEYSQTSYTSHISKIEETLFLNMQEEGKEEFYLYKLELTGDKEFKLYELTDNIDEKFNTSEELNAFIKQHKDLSFFYNKDESKFFKK